jgi:multisubunit Na+/H+ antiporter MnhC subunit
MQTMRAIIGVKLIWDTVNQRLCLIDAIGVSSNDCPQFTRIGEVWINSWIPQTQVMILTRPCNPLQNRAKV